MQAVSQRLACTTMSSLKRNGKLSWRPFQRTVKYSRPASGMIFSCSKAPRARSKVCSFSQQATVPSSSSSKTTRPSPRHIEAAISWKTVCICAFQKWSDFYQDENFERVCWLPSLRHEDFDTDSAVENVSLWKGRCCWERIACFSLTQYSIPCINGSTTRMNGGTIGYVLSNCKCIKMPSLPVFRLISSKSWYNELSRSKDGINNRTCHSYKEFSIGSTVNILFKESDRKMFFSSFRKRAVACGDPLESSRYGLRLCGSSMAWNFSIFFSAISIDCLVSLICKPGFLRDVYRGFKLNYLLFSTFQKLLCDFCWGQALKFRWKSCGNSSEVTMKTFWRQIQKVRLFHQPRFRLSLFRRSTFSEQESFPHIFSLRILFTFSRLLSAKLSYRRGDELELHNVCAIKGRVLKTFASLSLAASNATSESEKGSFKKIMLSTWRRKVERNVYLLTKEA